MYNTTNILKLLKNEPTFDNSLLLNIIPIVPLSLCDIAENNFKSTILPSRGKILGLFENALGIHITPSDRKRIVNNIFGKDHNLEDTGNGFTSILQNHIKMVFPKKEPKHSRYFDFSKKLDYDKYDNITNLKGSSYDISLIPLISGSLLGKIAFTGNKKDKNGLSVVELLEYINGNNDITLNTDQEILFNSGKLAIFTSKIFKREYIEYFEDINIEILTSDILGDILKECINIPEFPLYLGNSEGWIDATLENI